MYTYVFSLIFLINSFIFGMQSSVISVAPDLSRYCITDIYPLNESDNNGKIITTGRIYVGTYPFTQNKGSVKIISTRILDGKLPDHNNPEKDPVFFRINARDQERIKREFSALMHSGTEESKKLRVTIARHNKSSVILKATLSIALVRIFENRNSQLIWMPWDDDVVTDDTKDSYTKGYRVVRDGNAISFELKTPGSYELTLPHDTNLEVSVACGEVFRNE